MSNNEEASNVSQDIVSNKIWSSKNDKISFGFEVKSLT
jgi:hypothetical protein